MTVEQMSAHVEKLALEHNIKIEGISPDDNTKHAFMGVLKQGYSTYKTRSIQINPVVDEETYLIALHEIGHIVSEDEHKLQEMIQKNLVLGSLALLTGDLNQFEELAKVDHMLEITGEAYASSWALKNALEVTDYMKKLTLTAFLSHAL